jgi:hypothetical protein
MTGGTVAMWSLIDMHISRRHSAVPPRQTNSLAVCANTFFNFSQSEKHADDVLLLANGVQVRED